MKAFGLRNIMLYAIVMAVFLLLLQWMQYRLLIIDHSTEIYITCIAVLFTVLGMWLAKKLARTKTTIVKETVVVEKQITVYSNAPEAIVPDEKMIQMLGLSQREMEVLQLMAAGATNQEIADKLFLSLSTIKTHAARLFEKLDVGRRTQAIEKAKRLNIIT